MQRHKQLVMKKYDNLSPFISFTYNFFCCAASPHARLRRRGVSSCTVWMKNLSRLSTCSNLNRRNHFPLARTSLVPVGTYTRASESKWTKKASNYIANDKVCLLFSLLLPRSAVVSATMPATTVLTFWLLCLSALFTLSRGIVHLSVSLSAVHAVGFVNLIKMRIKETWKNGKLFFRKLLERWWMECVYVRRLAWADVTRQLSLLYLHFIALIFVSSTLHCVSSTLLRDGEWWIRFEKFFLSLKLNALCYTIELREGRWQGGKETSSDTDKSLHKNKISKDWISKRAGKKKKKNKKV